MADEDSIEEHYPELVNTNVPVRFMCNQIWCGVINTSERYNDPSPEYDQVVVCGVCWKKEEYDKAWKVKDDNTPDDEDKK